MQSVIEYGPSFAMATVTLAAGESVTVEAGSMVGMTDGMQLKTHIGGTKLGFVGFVVNVLLALARKFLGGETLFVNTYTPPAGGGSIMIAPALAGDIVHYRLDGSRKLMVQGSSYLASAGDVAVKTRFGGLRSLFSGEGAFWLEVSGVGELWINCYGAIHEIEVDGTYVVDTGHTLAFEHTLRFAIKGAGSLKSTLLSGEGLTCHFSGRGKLYIQSRTVGGLVGWITPRLPA
jgi:uncharacterized protein (TIGR00266 family)